MNPYIHHNNQQKQKQQKKTLQRHEIELVYSTSPIYRNFNHPIKSKSTKSVYSHTLYKYYLSRSENKNLRLGQIIQKKPQDIEYEI